MKILYINSLYSPFIGGGAEVMLKSLVEGMQKRGHDVSVLTTGQDTGLKTEKVDGIRVWRAEIKNLYWQYNSNRPNKMFRLFWHWNDRYNAKMRTYVKKVIKDEQPDIVNCHNLAGWSIAVWDEVRESGMPIVQTLHDYYLLCSRSTMYDDNKECLEQCRVCSKLRYNHAMSSKDIASVVGVSQYVIDRVCRSGYFENSRKTVIHNSCDVPIIEKKEKKFKSGLIFGYIGTLSQSKGIEWLITQFQKHNISGSLLIAGSGQASYETYLKSLVRSDRVKFCGYMPAREFFLQIDVCVVPSLWSEPFGMVAVEANASHIPVITSGKGGLSEIVKHKENGLIVDSHDPDSLGKALRRITEDHELYQSIVNSARESVAKYIDMSRMLDSYQQVYETCIA